MTFRLDRLGAHPRSRGENQDENIVNLSKQGSSPLTRGKRRLRRGRAQRHGLIPAHAGKTRPSRMPVMEVRAHPRSRGENVSIEIAEPPHAGSSPLTRGKRVVLTSCVDRVGLIPAHAGKTSNEVIGSPVFRAHPRSRGENVVTACLPAFARGSSPLTRGKPGEVGVCSVGERLIPAHAGKTVDVAVSFSGSPAHPRSRGENRRTVIRGRG